MRGARVRCLGAVVQGGSSLDANQVGEGQSHRRSIIAKPNKHLRFDGKLASTSSSFTPASIVTEKSKYFSALAFSIL